MFSYFYLLKQVWLHTTEKRQNETKPSENPVLLVKDIVQKTGKLDRELVYLLNKAKYYVPKTKPTGNSFKCLKVNKWYESCEGEDYFKILLHFLKEKLAHKFFQSQNENK